MRVVVTGGQGQLGRELARTNRAFEMIPLARAELDITNPAAIEAMMAGLEPDVVVNTAAYHQVDLCESEPEQSFLVNAAAPQRLSAACHRRGALFVHVSTDYVFDGEKGAPYVEEDPVGPLSVYGASKAAGEMAVRATTDRHIIARTTGLFGLGGLQTGRGNFVETMLRLGRAGTPLQVVCDQVMTPTAATDLAVMILDLIRAGVSGTYHCTNSGEASWYDFAVEIFRQAGIDADLRPTKQAERPTPARRPTYSVLKHAGLHRLGLPEPRPWQEALASYLVSRGAAVSA